MPKKSKDKEAITEIEHKEASAIWEDISALKEWDENPRYNSEAVQHVVKSIKRFGFGAPIIARKADGMIIAGHTRFQAAIMLQLEKVPVRYLDLDPADAKLLAIADNKVGEIATWNEDLLRITLSELKDKGLEGIGFSDDELNNLFAEAPGYEPPKDDELDISSFSDFEHKCPRCGFEWDA